MRTARRAGGARTAHHLGYLEALLQTELEDREQRLILRRLREARLPRMKTLEEFEFARNPKVSAQEIHELAKGDYIARAEPIIFIGESGTGKTHLLTGLAVAACRQKRRVRFASAAGLINELVEAKTAVGPRALALGALRSYRTR